MSTAQSVSIAVSVIDNFSGAMGELTRAVRRLGETARAFMDAYPIDRHRSGHRHRGTRAWARRYEHR